MALHLYTEDDGPAPSFNDEWAARYRPFLVSTDPHQSCLRRADELDVPVEAACHCGTDEPCQKECCR